MLINSLLLIGGLVLLIKGAGWLVNGGTALAKRYNVSDLAIGLTIVAFGTSAPELVVNIMASYQGHQDLVFGNVIGSNNFNLFLILGIAGIITPLAVKSGTVWRQIPLSLLAAVLLYLLANDHFTSGSNLLSRIDGLILLLMFCLFLFYVYEQMKTDPTKAELQKKELSGIKTWIFIIAGLAGLIVGGRIVVNNAVEIARALGLSEKVVGLTIVAAGTSLPELATSVVAAARKNIDIAVGNIIGSNIFNIFLILAASSLVRPIQYDPVFNRDLYLLAGGTLFLFITMFTGQKRKLDRWEAVLLLVAYLVYMVVLVYREV